MDEEYDHDGGLAMYESRNKKGTREKQAQRQKAAQIADYRCACLSKFSCIYAFVKFISLCGGHGVKAQKFSWSLLDVHATLALAAHHPGPTSGSFKLFQCREIEISVAATQLTFHASLQRNTRDPGTDLVGAFWAARNVSWVNDQSKVTAVSIYQGSKSLYF